MSTAEKSTVKPTSPAVRMSKAIKAEKVAKVIELREKAKAMYVEAEALEAELLDAMAVNEQVKLPNGKLAQLVDKFADKNIVWAHASVRRFSLEVPK